MQDDLTRVVGLEGFEVKRVGEVGDQLDLEVELVARAGCCPQCGRASLDIKERPIVRVRDLPLAGRRTDLVWRKRRFVCHACGRTFTEEHPQLPPRQRVTRRFRARLLERVRGGGAHAEVASQERTTRYQVARAFRDGASERVAREGGPVRRLSLDEAHHRRGRELATVVSDLDRRCVVEVLDGRSRRRVERYLRSLPEQDRLAIEVVSIDPYEAYRQAIKTVLPEARIVADHFHLVRGANTALDSVRRERQREAGRRRPKGARRSGQQARWRPDLYRARHRLLRATERLSERERRRLCELFEREPLIAEAWGLKEAFRHIYKAPDRVEAQRRLDNFLAAVERAQLPSFKAFADGVRLWREELLAYFDEPTTNGYAEGVINKVKVIKRRAYGLPTPAGLWRGRHTLPTGPRDLRAWLAYRVRRRVLRRMRVPFPGELPPPVGAELRAEYEEWLDRRSAAAARDRGPMPYLAMYLERHGFLAMHWEVTSALGIRRSLPFVTREVLELAFECHPSELVGPGTKRLLRHALRGDVPTLNLERPDKGTSPPPPDQGPRRWRGEIPGPLEPMLEPGWPPAQEVSFWEVFRAKQMVVFLAEFETARSPAP